MHGEHLVMNAKLGIRLDQSFPCARRKTCDLHATQNKWALVLLPAPTTPDLWKSLARRQFFPVSGVRITNRPERLLGHQTAVGLSPGVDLSGEALTRT